MLVVRNVKGREEIGSQSNSFHQFYQTEGGRGTLRSHNNRFTTFQVLAHHLDVLPRGHMNEFTKLLANFDLLTRVDGELEVLWGLKDQNDGATQPESTHLLSRSQGLTMEERGSSGIHRLTVGSWGWRLSVFVRSEISVKVDLDAPDVRSSDGDHAKEPVFPSPEESNSLVQNEKVMQPPGDIGRHREKFTNEMPALFDDPSGGTVEPMVVARGEVDDAEEEGVPGPNAGSGGTSTTVHSCAWSHFGCDFDRFE